MSPYKCVGLTVKSDLDHRDEAVKMVVELLQKFGAEVCVDEKRCGDIPGAKTLETLSGKNALDLLVILGGDGTILRTVRELTDFSIPLLTINRGNIGFLAEMNIDEAGDLLPKLLGGDGVLDERSLLRVQAMRGKESLFEGNVLNEAVISQGTIARLMELQASIDGEPLATFRADGLILATPTGSTAYSLAAGGPIVHPRLSAMILTPINSHSFNQKPIVIPGDQHVTVEVLPKENKFGDIDVSLTLDGQTYITLKRHDRIEAHINSKTVKFLRRRQETFYGTLREKLKWGETVEG